MSNYIGCFLKHGWCRFPRRRSKNWFPRNGNSWAAKPHVRIDIILMMATFPSLYSSDTLQSSLGQRPSTFCRIHIIPSSGKIDDAARAMFTMRLLLVDIIMERIKLTSYKRHIYDVLVFRFQSSNPNMGTICEYYRFRCNSRLIPAWVSQKCFQLAITSTKLCKLVIWWASTVLKVLSDIALKKWERVEIIILDREKNKCLDMKENLKKDWDLGVANIYALSLEKLN